MLTADMNVIYTNVASCRNCNLCQRVCPVKAISVSGDRMVMDYDRCISCGICVKECPSGSKLIYSCTEQIQNLIGRGKKVAASVAPSFAAAFQEDEACKIPGVLKRLGFKYTSEAVEGAGYATEDMLKNINGGNICTACPAVISYVEKHKPELKRIIMPVTSPMVSHGRMLKERLGSDWIVVFIGPCAAKRMESQRTENKGAVDFVLTFSELIQWIADEGVDMGQCGESDFESHVSLNEARLFPLRGGLYKNNDGEKNRGQALHVTGPIDVLRILNQDPDKWEHKVIEPLFCSDGCINGSGFPADKSLFDRRKDLICYARNRAQKV